MLKHGTFLAYPCEDEGRGFFVEVSVPDDADEAQVLRSFVSAVPLEDYSHYVQLPGEWAP